MKDSKQQDQQNMQKQQKQQGQPQRQQSKESSLQSSLNEYGTLTAKEDANNDYTAAGTNATDFANTSLLKEKSKPFADDQDLS